MARQAKRLVDHILDRTFRPTAHQKLLAGVDLPLDPLHRDPSPAMTRTWKQLRALQAEHRSVASVEIQHDLALQFGRTAGEYMSAVEYAQMDPTKDIAGIAACLEVNDRALARWEAEQQAQRKADATR